MSTTRAIIHFAYARYELWALGIKHSAVLNNHIAVDYTPHDDDTPVATGIKFTAADMPEQVNSRRVSTYRDMIGVLNWIAQMTFPELTFGVSYFSQWMHNPSEEMLEGVMRMFRYLKFIVLNNCEGANAHRGRSPFPCFH